MIKTIRPSTFDFYVAIEFPSPRQGVIAANGMRLWRVDVEPEIEIKSCEALTIHMDAEGVMWGEAVMWAWPAGGPIFDGKPVVGDNHQIVTATFNVHIVKVLSKLSYNKGYEEGWSRLHGRPLTAARRMRNRRMVEA